MQDVVKVGLRNGIVVFDGKHWEALFKNKCIKILYDDITFVEFFLFTSAISLPKYYYYYLIKYS